MIATGNKFIDNYIFYDLYGRHTFPKNLYNAMLFCATNSGLHKSIAPGSKVFLEPMSPGQGGYAKPTKKQLFLNSLIFTDKYYEEMGFPEDEQLRAMLAVLFFSHFEVHEASHIAWTKVMNDDISVEITNATNNSVLARNPLFNTLFQQCEDMYVENNVRVSPDVGGFYEFVKNSWYFFSPMPAGMMLLEKLQQVINGDYTGIDLTICPTIEDEDKLIKYIIVSMKIMLLGILRSITNRIDDFIIPVQDAYEIAADNFLSNQNPESSVKERILITLEIFKILVGEDFDKFVEDFTPRSTAEDFMNGLIDKINEEIENGRFIPGSLDDGTKPSHTQNRSYSTVDKYGNELNAEEIGTIFQETYKKAQGKFRPEPIGGFIFLDDEVRFSYSSINALGTSEYIPDNSFAILAKKLQYVRANVLKAAIPLKSGTNLLRSRLSRIATDGRIFGNPEDVAKKGDGKPEVIFLIDISGSTDGYMADRKPLYQKECEAVLGAMQALKAVGVPCAAYAHTTTEGKLAAVYGIAACNMPFQDGKKISIVNHSDLGRRFAAVANLPHNYNADGDALALVSEYFSKSNRQKFVLVFSDGRPTATSYTGQTAESFLKIVIDNLRIKGIKIFSFSLVPDVTSYLDNLYGAKFNCRSYNGLLEKELTKIITEIAK